MTYHHKARGRRTQQRAAERAERKRQERIREELTRQARKHTDKPKEET